jgi:O-antigen/teichoic acid export membrane protein
VSVPVSGGSAGAAAPEEVRWGALVIRGAAWVAGSRFLAQFVQLLAGIVLARVLTPSDFGLAATVFIFVGLAGLVNDAGLATALVHKPTVEPEDLSSTFWVNFLLGIVMAAALSALAPVLAVLYHQPALRELTWVVAIAFALNVSVVPAALLERELRFRALALCDLGSSVAGVAASVGALALGAGAFSLVVPSAVSAVVRSGMAMRAAHWTPTLAVSRSALRYLWSFSGFFTLGSLIFHVQNNFGSLLVGWRMGPSQLGLFSRGQTLSGIPTEQVPAITAAAAVPALASLRRHGRDLTEPYVRAHAATATLAVLLLGYLALTADFLVPFVYGDQWTGSVEILQWLCLAGVGAAVAGPSMWICYIAQRTDLLFRWQAVAATATVSGVVIGSRWQAVGVAKGLAVVGLALIVPAVVYGGRIAGIPVRATVRGLAPGLLLASAATMSSVAVRCFLPDSGLAWVTFAAVSVTFAVVVLGGVWGLARRGIVLPGLDVVLRRLRPAGPRQGVDPTGREEAGRRGRFAYVVIAHKNPEQVVRLVRAIRRTSPTADTLVAYNGRLSRAGAAALGEAGARRVGSGRPARWGSFSLVERVLEAFEAARHYDWVVLVSGADYPTRPLDEWERWLRSQDVEAVIAAEPVTEGDVEPWNRIAYRWLVLRFRGPFRWLPAVIFRLVPKAWADRVRVLEGFVFVAYRRAIPPAASWKGSMWLAVSGPMLQHVLASAPVARQTFLRALVPDESCIQTVVATSGLPRLHADVTFTRWPGRGAPHPDALGPEDFDEVTRCDAPFARKMSGARGAQLCDLLDEKILDPASVPVP